ncbi:MAG: hypothetical protein E7K04_01615 [Helicobacter sp.]|nr:hypothetical protein [Helicobacter sp.]
MDEILIKVSNRTFRLKVSQFDNATKLKIVEALANKDLQIDDLIKICIEKIVESSKIESDFEQKAAQILLKCNAIL